MQHSRSFPAPVTAGPSISSSAKEGVPSSRGRAWLCLCCLHLNNTLSFCQAPKRFRRYSVIIRPRVVYFCLQTKSSRHPKIDFQCTGGEVGGGGGHCNGFVVFPVAAVCSYYRRSKMTDLVTPKQRLDKKRSKLMSTNCCGPNDLN